MSFERLTARGKAIGEHMAARKQSELLNKTDLPQGVVAEIYRGGIALVGRGLRRRFVTDGIFRRRIR